MASINAIPNCALPGGNLGVPECAINPALIVGAIAVPKGTTFNAADIADFQTTLQTLVTNATKIERGQIMGGFLEIDDQSEDIQEKTYGYGQKVVTRDEQYVWSFQYLDGGFCYHRQMLGFKGKEGQYDFLFVDSAGVIWGTQATDATTGAPAVKGIALTQIYVYNWKAATGSDPARYMVRFTIANAKQINEQAAFISDLGFDVFTDINLVQDINFDFVTSDEVDADGDIALALTTGCGGTNLVSAYPTEVVNASRYTVVNTATGAAISFTVASAGTGDGAYLAFNLDDTDPDYPTAGGYITIAAVAPSAWAALDLPYFEAIPKTIIVT